MTSTKSLLLAEAKLATSRLDLGDASRLGIEIVDSAQSHDPSWPDVPALLLHYYDLEGKRVDGMLRARVLEQRVGAFGAVDDRRYLQPSGTTPHAYYPTIVDWQAIAKDPAQQIVITEGELKAACACRAGFSCVGLGGVWSWRSARLGWSTLPSFESVTWAHRDVVIAFDSDAQTNPDIAAATAALAKDLGARGALVRVAMMPPLEDLEKTGIDDYLVRRGIEAAREVIAGAAPLDDLGRELWRCNGRYTLILQPLAVRDNATGQLHKPGDWKSTVEADWRATQSVPAGKGGKGVKLVEVSVPEEWIKWKGRRKLAGITYAPGGPDVADGCQNTWRGFACAPAPGDVSPWTRLLDHLFTGADHGAREWFESWCLYPIQHPGTKMLQACGLWSQVQGVGKSLVGCTLGEVYGAPNYSLVGQADLESSFNGWSVEKQFVMIDDVSGFDSRSKADTLKKLITQDRVMVNRKHIDTYQIADVANYLLTSNRVNAFYIEPGDRRWFVHEVTVGQLDPAFYEAYHAWLNGPGPAALLHHAQTVDLSAFSPFRPPPTTQAKTAMMAVAMTELDAWIARLAQSPVEITRAKLDAACVTAEEMSALFDAYRHGPAATAQAVRRSMVGQALHVIVDGVDYYGFGCDEMTLRSAAEARAKERRDAKF